MEDSLIYLDNAATSFPKPRSLLNRMTELYAELGCSPGRGGYDLAMEAHYFVEETRLKLSRYFNAPDPNRIVFTSNATDSLNMAIQGLVKQGDHVISTRLEHNSVLRPLFHLKNIGLIDYSLVSCPDGFVDLSEIEQTVKPNTKLVIVNHASNVLGTIQPIAEIGRLCAKHGLPLLIDAAQSAGQTPIDMEAWHIAAVAFTGHKALMGPAGIGGLALSPELDIESTRFGGTGVDSASLIHTQSFPYRLEAGTLNLPGIIGLSLGLDFISEAGQDNIRQRESTLAQKLYLGLKDIENVILYTPCPGLNNVPIVICNIKGKAAADVGAVLDGDFGIAVRTGLHCAPLVAEDILVSNIGTIRFSPGYFNDENHIDAAIEAVSKIAER